jgi:hypothetical protein
MLKHSGHTKVFCCAEPKALLPFLEPQLRVQTALAASSRFRTPGFLERRMNIIIEDINLVYNESIFAERSVDSVRLGG